MLGEAQAVHAKNLNIGFHLDCRSQISNINIDSLPRSSDGSADFSRSQSGISLVCPAGRFACLIFGKLEGGPMAFLAA